MIKKTNWRKGAYKKSVTQDARITRTILLLATGHTTRKQLIKNGVSPYAWDKKSNRETENSYKSCSGYKDRLLVAKFIQEIKDTDGKSKRGDYTFNWGILLTHILNMMLSDIKQNIFQLENAASQTFKKGEKIKKLFEKCLRLRRIPKKEVEKEVVGTFPIGQKETLWGLGYKIAQLKHLSEEFRIFKNKSEDYEKKLYEDFQTFLKENNQKNWFICQLITYFEDLLYSKIVYENLETELRNFLYCLSYNKTINMGISPIAKQQRYFFNNEEINVKEVIELISSYYYYSSMRIEWLVYLKPVLKQEIKKAEQMVKRKTKIEQNKAKNYLKRKKIKKLRETNDKKRVR